MSWKDEQQRHRELCDKVFNEMPWIAVDANREIIIGAVNLEDYPVDRKALLKAADRLDSQNKLLIAADWAEPWAVFIAENPDFNTEANRRVAFSTIDYPRETPSKAAFVAMAERTDPPIFCITQETQQRYDDQAERQRLRKEIVNGKSVFKMRNQFGVVQVYDSETGHKVEYHPQGGAIKSRETPWWDVVDLQTLRQVHRQIMEERRLETLGRADLRRTASPTRRDDIQSGGDFRTTLQHTQNAQSAAQATDDFVLMHPDLGEPFNKTTLIRFLNSGNSSENARRILVRNNKIYKPAETAMLRLLGKIK